MKKKFDYYLHFQNLKKIDNQIKIEAASICELNFLYSIEVEDILKKNISFAELGEGGYYLFNRIVELGEKELKETGTNEKTRKYLEKINNSFRFEVFKYYVKNNDLIELDLYREFKKKTA